jgi:hypothetical protein
MSCVFTHLHDGTLLISQENVFLRKRTVYSFTYNSTIYVQYIQVLAYSQSDSDLESESELLYYWRLPPVSSSCIKSLETHDQSHLYSQCRCEISSGVYMLGILSSVRISHTTCYSKYSVSTIYKQIPCQYRLCKADHDYLIYFTLQWHLCHFNSLSLTASKFKSHIFRVWLRLVLCCEHILSHDFVWLLLFTCTILLCNRIHTECCKLCANRGPVCTLENF